MGKVDFGATYPWDDTDPKVDQVAVGARADGDDVSGYNVYEQKIASINASATPVKVPTGGNADVTVVVKDQNRNPIAGAQVFREGTPGTLVGYTNEKGDIPDQDLQKGLVRVLRQHD